MKRRIFIAVNLPEKTKEKLKQYQEKFDYLPVRWTKKASLHLTLIFIGYVSDDQMLEVCRAAREVASKVDPFFINFKKIILGPFGKPRMIWLEGEANQQLVKLKNKLQKELLDCDSGFYRAENRPLKPHVTLARIKMEQWRQANINISEVEQVFEAQIPINSIEVMESDLKISGAEYATLESCPLAIN